MIDDIQDDIDNTSEFWQNQHDKTAQRNDAQQRVIVYMRQKFPTPNL